MDQRNLEVEEKGAGLLDRTGLDSSVPEEEVARAVGRMGREQGEELEREPGQRVEELKTDRPRCLEEVPEEGKGRQERDQQAKEELELAQPSVLAGVLLGQGLERKDRMALVIQVPWAAEVERVPELARVVQVEVRVFREPPGFLGMEAVQAEA